MSRHGRVDAITLPSRRVAQIEGDALQPGRNPGRARLVLSRTIGKDRVHISAPQGALVLSLGELRALVEEVAADE